MLESLDSLRRASGMLAASDVKTLAGQVSWAFGMLMWLKAFNKTLWHFGVLYLTMSRPPSRPQTCHLLVVRIKTALDWVHAALVWFSCTACPMRWPREDGEYLLIETY
eukprot:1248166-Amphidinium_carterae.4